MKRLEIIEAAKIVRTALEISGIKAVLEGALRQDRSAEATAQDQILDPHTIVKTMRLFFSFTESFGKAETRLINALGLHHLLDVNQSFWGNLFNAETIHQHRGMILATYRAIQFSSEKLPHIVQLLQQEGLEKFDQEHEQEDSSLFGQALLTVVLIESEEERSRPERLIEMLEGVSLLYEVSGIVLGQQDHNLSVIAIDSGSDKRFDFVGVERVIETVKEILVAVYKIAAFHPDDQRDRLFSLISQQLDFVNEIGRLERDQSIPAEQAAKLRRDVLNGAAKFLNAGAIIPEMEAAIGIDARQVMAPEKKYLVAPQHDQNYGDSGQQGETDSEADDDDSET